MTNTVKIVDSQRELEIDDSQTILEFLLKNKINIDHSCGGLGTCGTCRIEVLNHQLLEPRNELEKERACDLNFCNEERLACQIKPVANLKIKAPITT